MAAGAGHRILNVGRKERSATASSDYRIVLLDANAPSRPLVFLPALHAHLVTHLRWHGSGTWLLSADDGGHIIIWRCRVRARHRACRPSRPAGC